MLRLEALEVRQGSFTLTANVTLTARVTALIGPSGSGKSTLLNSIAGFVTPATGHVLWNQQDITAATPAARPVSMLFQDNNLFPHLTVDENIALALTHRRPSDAQRTAMVAALDRVGLSGFGARRPGTLSGGQQSRAALARVMLQNRPLVLLDEPFAALGPALKHDMLDLVADLAREHGLQILMVSHDPADALRIADEACVLADGRISPPQRTTELLANPPPDLKRYLGDV
ncbi:MAG: ATP-binding cassette domain-containing protein [Pseudomonadota bacterium]